MTIAEPDVTLSDYALTLECAVLAWLLFRRRGGETKLRSWFVVFFCAVGVAALTGGTVHGFMTDEASLVRAVVWKSTLIAIGVSALAAWMIGARSMRRARVAQWVRTAAVMLFVVYLVAVTVVDSFLTAAAHYLPAAVFLLLIYGLEYLRTRRAGFLWGVVGLLLTLAAAGVQQAGIGLHPASFDHNALYHSIQGVALLFLFAAARRIIGYTEA